MKMFASFSQNFKHSLSISPRSSIAAMAFTILAGIGQSQAAPLPKLSVAADPSVKPFAYMDQKSHQMEGFDMDLIRALAPLAGYQVQVLPLDFAGIIPALQSGNVQASASSITITDARKKVIDFSNPYYDSGLQVLVKDGQNGVSSMEDLKGKTVAAVTGSTGYIFTQETLGSDVKLVPYATYAAAFLALTVGNTDAVVGDQPMLANYSTTAGKGKVKVVGPLYHGEQYGIAFNKGSPWVEPTNKALQTLKENGTYAQIYQKWFGVLPPQTPIVQQ
ncbi:periplasmic component of amino acid ABC-type transporter/signal transduction system [Pseudomonas sp. GM49]|uniref:transporter substrate-binding domain-containing protein n=1 Tax=Pseudomonas sp. GM49 TaxID=1144331 RepID=UPI00026FDC17|nr:transporter substrate-binding domain-containing protein [Pseudomonas sp. GM49]EJM67407.1 periplasmic component of amino acid ABC-type transporter/signal transduction system [Pseudomonas sp. GM49]